MTEGSLFISSLDKKFCASFSGGDDIVDGYRLYHVVLRDADGTLYKEGMFSNGKFV